MSTKKKKEHRSSEANSNGPAQTEKHPSPSAEAEARDLIQLLKRTLSPEKFEHFCQTQLNPGEAPSAEAQRADEIRELFDDLPALVGFGETPEFQTRWESFLKTIQTETEQELIRKGVPQEKVERLIVPGWAYVDADFADVRYRFGPPSEELTAVRILLTFHNAEWQPPLLMEAAVTQHPSLLPAIEKNDDAGMKDTILRRLRWATALVDAGYSSRRLQDLSQGISDMLHPADTPDPIEEAWISGAIRSERFWMILGCAMDFGLHHNARRLFLDGKLLGNAQRSALNDKVEELPWYLVIEEAVREYSELIGEVPTPAKLRKYLKVRGEPGATSVDLEFRDPRFAVYGKITWGKFQWYAKQAAKIWGDHRTK